MQEILIVTYLISIILYWIFIYLSIKDIVKKDTAYVVTASDVLIDYFLSFVPIWNTVIVVYEIYINYLKNTFEEIFQKDITKFFK